jgi:pyruvate/2-oxoglutarate dehydrogenase complex dihydrolipoamide acyltransferase (E2) component
MRRAIVVPEIGVATSLISVWYAHLGEHVYGGDRLVELLMGSATFDVGAPCTGWLVEKLAWPQERVTAGQVLGYVDEDAEL